MSAPDWRALVDRGRGTLPIRRQCELLGLVRSGVDRPLRPANESDLTLMRRIDDLFTPAGSWARAGWRGAAIGLAPHGADVAHGRTAAEPEAADAEDGHCRTGAEDADHQAGAGSQDVPVSAVQLRDRAAEPGVGVGH